MPVFLHEQFPYYAWPVETFQIRTGLLKSREEFKRWAPKLWMSHRTFTSLLIDLVQKGARLTDAELAHLRKKAVDGCQSLFANTLDDNQLQRSTLQAWDRLLRQLGDKSSTIRAAYEEAKEAVETHRLEADREYAADHEADAESSSVNTLRSSSRIQPEDDIVVEVDLSEAMTMPLSRPASSQSSPSPSEMSSAGSLRSDEESGSENEETTV